MTDYMLNYLDPMDLIDLLGESLLGGQEYEVLENAPRFDEEAYPEGRLDQDFGDQIETWWNDMGFSNDLNNDGNNANDLLAQMLADVTGRTILRPTIAEASAMGVAMLAATTSRSC